MLDYISHHPLILGNQKQNKTKPIQMTAKLSNTLCKSLIPNSVYE